MYLMYADEADPDDNPRARHFIYGAVFISSDKAEELHDEICRIRTRFGYTSKDSFKFKDRSRPEQVSRENHRAAKQAALTAAARHGVTFCSYVMPHAIARTQNRGTLIKFGANTLLERFNRFCNDADDFGAAMFDRMPVDHEFAFYAEKFTLGLQFQGGVHTSLKNVLSYASTADQCSHFSSVTDILVGSFRYCINEEERAEPARAMFPQLVRMMWSKTRGGQLYVRELGINFRPKLITHPRYQADRDALIDRLNGYLNPPLGRREA